MSLLRALRPNYALELPTFDPEAQQESRERMRKMMGHSVEFAVPPTENPNPYSPDALTAADIARGDEIFCYSAEAGSIALKYSGRDTSGTYLNRDNELEVVMNRRLMLATNMTLASIGIVSRTDGSWAPAVSFHSPEDFDQATFTDDWHQLVAES